MATLFNPFFQAIDGNGDPIAGAKLYFYTTGTSTLQNTYSQSDLAPANVNTNPVVANADGRFGPIYLATTADYKAILKDASDVTVGNGTVDPLFAAGTSGRVAVNDASYAAQVTDRTIAYTAISSARTVTLPAALNFTAGDTLLIVDESGSASSTVTISVALTGSDTIRGVSTARVAISSAYGSIMLESDGTSKWTMLKAANLSTQVFLSGSGTYTRPGNCTALRVRVQGGGGGGGGVGGTTGPTGATGGTSSFNSITAIGGSGGTGATGGTQGVGGVGGTGGAGTASFRIVGGAGGVIFYPGTNGYTGGLGGGSHMGPGTPAFTAAAAATGNTPAANTGAGGGGAASPGNTAPAAGGGGGECFELHIASPAATYTYAVGAGGAGGIGTGTGAATGGAGAAGIVIVEEFYS